jgi:hypothetical protein
VSSSAIGGAALEHQRQLPRQVGGIVQARVQAAHAEDRHQVRGVAGEQHAAVAVAGSVRHLALYIEAHSGSPGRVLADHGEVALHARQDVLRLQRLLRVLVVAQLVVDAPDVVGLAVHQERGAGVGRRVEPGQPLHRPRVGCTMSTMT